MLSQVPNLILMEVNSITSLLTLWLAHFENEDVNAKKYGSLCFGSINEVMDGDDLGCLNEAKTRRLVECEDCSTVRA